MGNSTELDMSSVHRKQGLCLLVYVDAYYKGRKKAECGSHVENS